MKSKDKREADNSAGVLKALRASPDLEAADGLFRNIPSKQRFVWNSKMHLFLPLASKSATKIAFKKKKKDRPSGKLNSTEVCRKRKHLILS